MHPAILAMANGVLACPQALEPAADQDHMDQALP
jgi:hypothetical protein